MPSFLTAWGLWAVSCILAGCLSGLAGEWARSAWRTLWTGERHTAWPKTESQLGWSRLSPTQWNTPCRSAFPTADLKSQRHLYLQEDWLYGPAGLLPETAGGWGAGPKGQNACTKIYIHHLGLPINPAIHIALQLQAGSLRSLHKAASPSAMELVGEQEPGTDAGEPVTQIRKLSKPRRRLQSHTQVIEMRLAYLKHPPTKN